MTIAKTATSTTHASGPVDDSTHSVLVADSFQAAGLEAMERLGCRVEYAAELTAGDLPAALASGQPDVLVVRSTKVSEAALAATDALSLVIRAGAGYDTIDVAGASTRGIFVANCPGKNAIAVAELAWALILSCDRRVPDQTADLRAGTWNKKGYARARGIYGRTLGIVGVGRIGLAVAERGRAFGMRIVAWSRNLTPETAAELGFEYAASPLDVARQADVISLHVASTPETRHLVDDAFCASMKDGAILVNTTRGAVVDEAALARAIKSKSIRAGLDVYANEPAAGDSFDTAIVHEPGVYGTHHIGASTDQAQEAIAAEAVRILEIYVATGAVPNCVNRSALPPTCLLTVRHLNRPGVLAHVFNVLSEAAINVEEMENLIYEGAQAACAQIQLEERPEAEPLEAIAANEHILSINIVTMGS
ncbi:MAG: hydroxyacid dehydrogenase [Planctomycetes bacterium]|nr:hydroxyacid dehydrogenase [Planctomycetota bacterium]